MANMACISSLSEEWKGKTRFQSLIEGLFSVSLKVGQPIKTNFFYSRMMWMLLLFVKRSVWARRVYTGSGGSDDCMNPDGPRKSVELLSAHKTVMYLNAQRCQAVGTQESLKIQFCTTTCNVWAIPQSRTSVLAGCVSALSIGPTHVSKLGFSFVWPRMTTET